MTTTGSLGARRLTGRTGFVSYNTDGVLRVLNFDRESHRFKEGGRLPPVEGDVANVIPVDLELHGALDVVVQVKAGKAYDTLIFWGGVHAGNATASFTAGSELATYDVDGDGRADFIGKDTDGTTAVWRNTGGRAFEKRPLSEFVDDQVEVDFDTALPVNVGDFNGDCRGDLLFAVPTRSGTHNVTVLVSRVVGEKDDAVVRFTARSFATDLKLTSLAVLDMNRNGNVDLVATADNTVYWFENRQKELCRSLVSSDDTCRSQNDMCVADNGFRFVNHTAFQLDKDRTLVATDGYVRIAVGDYNIDGLPDMLLPVQNDGSVSYVVLKNTGDGTFKIDEDANKVVPEVSKGAVAAAMFDPNEMGVLDFFFNVEEDGVLRTKTVSNNLRPDALFAKVVGLNGECVSKCSDGYKDYDPDNKPYGLTAHGGVFKFALTDTKGKNVGMVDVQLSRTSHKSLSLPFSHVGLGRISNYIQVVSYGMSNRAAKNTATFTSIIPNSQLVVIAHPPSTARKWSMELYFLDLDLMFWIGIASAVGLGILAVIMLILFIVEKKKEIKRNLLNFK